MRTRMYFVIITALVCVGCADVKFLIREAIVPAGKATAESVRVGDGNGTVVVASTNIVEAAGKRWVHFSGMTSGNEFIYIASDFSKQVRKVESDGTIKFLFTQRRLVTVTYVYGDWGVSKVFYLDPRFDYQWNQATKTFSRL